MAEKTFKEHLWEEKLKTEENRKGFIIHKIILIAALAG